MNKFLLRVATALVCSPPASAQITLEQSYPGYNQIAVARMDTDGDKYYGVDTAETKVDFFNSNHSLWKSISLPVIPGSKGGNAYLASKGFFDTDPGVEVFVTYAGTAGGYTGVVVSETGAVETTIPDGAYASAIKVDNAWKVLVQCIRPLSPSPVYWKIYGAPGSYQGLTVPGTTGGSSNEADYSLYPNPAHTTATLRYSLPAGVSTGLMSVYNAQGQKVREYTLSSAFSDILVHTGDLAPGAYYYTVTAGQSTGNAQAFVIQ